MGWHYNDLTAATGAPLAIFAPMGYVFDAQDTQHIVYQGYIDGQGADGHIHELWWDSNGWHHNDLTAAIGAPMAFEAPWGYVFAAQGTQHVVYLGLGAGGQGIDGHIHELWWDSNGWHHNDLTAATGAPMASAPPLGYAFETQRTQHVSHRRNTELFAAFNKEESFEVVREILCPVDTLDRALAAAGVDRVDFVKLDTQGSELPILRGAATTLERYVYGVEVEINLNEIYLEQPLFGDVDAHLRAYGYELADIRPQWRYRYSGRGLIDGGRGQSVWGDALYLKGPAAVAERLAGLGPAEREIELAKHVAICLLYGIGDYALELVGQADIPAATSRELMTAVRNHDEAWASRHGVEYAFVLPEPIAGELQKLARGKGERERRRPPQWFTVRAIRRWLADNAPPSRTQQLRERSARLRQALRRG